MSLASFYERGFLPRLQTRRPLTPGAELAAVWGATLAPSLHALVDVLGEQPRQCTPEVGPFVAFALDDVLPFRGNAFDFMLAQPFRQTSLFSDTLALGTTGGGSVWLVDLVAHEGQHHVFLEDHDLGALVPVADSLESFAWLCQLLDEEASDEDPRWRELHGRVCGAADVRVPAAVAPWRPASTVPTKCLANADVSGSLRSGLSQGLSRLVDTSSVSACVSSALRLFLLEDEGLSSLLRTMNAHGARLVRDAATSLSRKTRHRGEERLRAVRPRG